MTLCICNFHYAFVIHFRTFNMCQTLLDALYMLTPFFFIFAMTSTAKYYYYPQFAERLGYLPKVT